MSQVQNYRAKQGVHWLTLGAQTVILDLNTGKYFMLIGSATEVWDLAISGLATDLIERQLALRYSLTIQTANQDISKFVTDLVALGLLVSSSAGEQVRDLSVPRIVKCLRGIRVGHRAEVSHRHQGGFGSIVLASGLLVLVDIGIRLFGLHRVSKWISWLYSDAICGDAGLDLVKNLAHIPLSAYRWYRPGAVCMQRAVATYWYLRSKGIEVHLCIGVATQPFASHCWVEYRGSPINEIQAEIRKFSQIARIV